MKGASKNLNRGRASVYQKLRVRGGGGNGNRKRGRTAGGGGGGANENAREEKKTRRGNVQKRGGGLGQNRKNPLKWTLIGKYRLERR